MTTIALPVMIKLMGAVVLVPHLAHRGYGAPSANALTHAPLNVNNMPTYAPSPLVEDRGTTVPTASSLATAAPVATSAVAAAAQTTPKAMLTISFDKLNTLLN